MAEISADARAGAGARAGCVRGFLWDAGEAEDGRPTGQQRALGWGAALHALLVTLVMASDPYFGGSFLLLITLFAAPLLLLRIRGGFTTGAAVLGALYTVCSVLGALAGLFFFAPSGILLLFAAFADGRRRPCAARVLTVLGALLLAFSLWCVAAMAWTYYVAPALGLGDV
ncbi:hypothetical protein ACIBEA_35675 [Streptomyces sp. NPDC051555]|uniref:hypothetical protein n=1 Tax=Streptomyces sp. NPDC051555 TaxID=3365657 RepID=UPI0037AB7229